MARFARSRHGAKTRNSCNGQGGGASAVMPLPLQIAYETLVALLEASLLEGADELGRGALARAVRVLPLVCVEAGTLARANPRAPLLLAVCDYLYFTGPRARYCDGLPLAVSPAHGPQFDSNDFIIEGAQHPHELETYFEQRDGWSDVLLLGQELLPWIPDLPTDLPERVLAFVARMRKEHTHMRLHPQFDRFFTTCQRKGCTRPALIVAPKPKPQIALKTRSSYDYWQLCATGSATLNARRNPRNMSFCCEGCFRVVDQEFCTKVDVLADVESVEFLPRSSRRDGAAPGAVTIGPCSVNRLYEAALLRNTKLDRRIRQGLTAPPTTQHYPLTKADAETMQQQAIDAVNIDLGVLYAAAIVAKNAPRWRPASLPCATDWRKRTNAYRNAVTRVRAIYKKYVDSKSVCRGETRWMRKVRKASEGLFT